jgi:hypothetical protein
LLSLNIPSFDGCGQYQNHPPPFAGSQHANILFRTPPNPAENGKTDAVTDPVSAKACFASGKGLPEIAARSFRKFDFTEFRGHMSE